MDASLLIKVRTFPMCDVLDIRRARTPDDSAVGSGSVSPRKSTKNSSADVISADRLDVTRTVTAVFIEAGHDEFTAGFGVIAIGRSGAHFRAVARSVAVAKSLDHIGLPRFFDDSRRWFTRMVTKNEYR